jgi:hypothetical protein
VLTGIKQANWERSGKINKTRQIETKPREEKEEREKTATLQRSHKEKRHCENTCVDGSIILKRIFKK